MKYIKIETATNGTVIARDNKDGSTTFIPIDESNSDYQAYLRWLNGEEEGVLN